MFKHVLASICIQLLVVSYLPAVDEKPPKYGWEYVRTLVLEGEGEPVIGAWLIRMNTLNRSSSNFRHDQAGNRRLRRNRRSGPAQELCDG